MRKLFVILFTFLALACGSELVSTSQAQSLKSEKFENVTWEFSMKQSGCDVELIFTATIADGWYIYSQFQPNSDGPIATSFSFKESKEFKLVGKTTEGKSKSKYMEGFDGEYNIFPHKAVFKQKIKVTSKKDFELKGEIEFMQCDESKCLPPMYPEFAFKIKGSDCAEENTTTNSTEVETEIKETTPEVNADTTASVNPVSLRIYSRKYSTGEYEIFLKFNVDSGWIIPSEKFSAKFSVQEGLTPINDLVKPEVSVINLNGKNVEGFSNEFIVSQKFRFDAKDSSVLKNVSADLILSALSGEQMAELKEKLSVKVNLNDAEEMNESTANQSYWAIFLVAFFSGFAALLTPCVFPMIPMTVSFFLKSSKNRKKAISNAIIYGVSIVVIYVVVGLIITAVLGPTALNEMSTSVFFNLLFFVVLVFFAISFLGAFEIVLPSSWANAMDKNADKGGMIGIFFMAFTLALVSFSCTGPIIGTLLVETVSKGIMGPIFGMFGFSLAIALPFTLFAIFPGWLNSMPSSGGWLNTVKVSLGFVELALSLKFLSKADLVNQTHLLEREVFIALFAAIFFIWGLYLLGVFRMSHDSETTKISAMRSVLATFVLGFVIYLLPGMWGAPLNLIAGFAPPQTYSESPFGVGGKAPDETGNELPEHAAYGPNQLVTFHDYEHGMEYAREQGKPAMIDFTGHGCENCRKMEQFVWSDPEVMKILSDSVVIISLHVDERTKFKEGDPEYGKFKNVGQKWAEMEVKKYGESSQPLYVLLDANEDMLNGKASYQTHGVKKDFHEWLVKGLETFKKRKGIRIIKPNMKIVSVK